MTSARYVKFRDIPSNVLQTIESTRRDKGLSELIKWGRETGYLSVTKLSNGQMIKTVHLICDNCDGKSDRHLYWVRKALKQGSRDAYCSKKCCGEHHSFKNSHRVCKGCGKGPLHRHQRYCSNECKPEIGSWARKGPKVCKFCGAEFPRSGTSRQYCSRKCADDAHSKRMRGSGNSKFRSERGPAAYSNLFRAMRMIIRQRDDHCCADCGNLAKKVRLNYRPRTSLQVHHIDENPLNNKPENLITLCERCHHMHHLGMLRKSPKFPGIAAERTRSMTSRLKKRVTSLLKEYSFTTA